MRGALVNTLTEMFERDASLMFLTADTGFHVFDDFQKRFADRYLNVGIAEAAMIGLSAGLAGAGRTVFVYGIAPFVTYRCFEQIRDDLCYPSLRVRIVGVGAGLTYGPAGVSHHTIEDIAVLRSLPNMTVICPGDPAEMASAVRASADWPGPIYFRAGKSGEKPLHPSPIPGFRIGQAIRLRAGEGLGLVATGNMLETALQVADLLAARGANPEVLSMHTVKPIDAGALTDLARRCPTLATLEEHNRIGGLGSAVAETLADAGVSVRLRRFGIADCFCTRAGSQDHLRRSLGLAADQIAGELAP